MTKRVIKVILVMALCVSVVVPMRAATISDIKKEKEAAEQQLNNIKSNISNIEGDKEVVSEEITELDMQLVELLSTVEILQQDIENKEIEIADAQGQYEVAKADEEAQYAAMKRRIKFMYEKGDVGYLQLFLESESMADLVNKVDYIEKLYEYDRNLLVTYQETKEKVLLLKENLENEKSEMVELEADLKAEQASLQVMIDEKRETVESFNAQLAAAKAEASAYSATIKAKSLEIKRLEAEEAKRKAEEAARKKAAEAAAKKSGSTSSTGSSSSTSASETIGSSAGSEKGKEIANFACQYVGNPYVAGGTSLTSGADCSGFTYAVFKNFGISIPRNSSAQASCGSAVEYASAEPGDIICYAGHVGLYIGGGKIVHASTQATGIKISYATYRSILTVRRYY